MGWTNYFYDGSVAEPSWSKAGMRVARSNYGVVGLDDLKVTVATGDRTVSIAAGDCWGKGVYSIHDAPETASLATVGSGDRYDLIAVHRDWNTNTTSIVVVTGSSTRGIPTSRDVGYGTEDDQPIALVKVKAGSTAIEEIIDLRCWAGSGGGLVARDELATQYLDEVGSRVFIGSTDWIITVSSTGSKVPVKVGHYQERLALTGTSSDWRIDGDITIETFGTGKKVSINARITRTGANWTLFSGGHVLIATITPLAARGGANNANFYQASVVGPGTFARTVSLMYGNGDGKLSIKNTDSSVVIVKDASFGFDHTFYIP